MPNLYVSQAGSDTTGDGTIGNPYATPGKAAGLLAATFSIFLKYNASPYLVTTATPNVSGGPIAISVSSNNGGTSLIGYDTNPAVDNTDANRPTIKLTVGSCTAVNLTVGTTECRNVIVDCNLQTASVAFAAGDYYMARFVRCKATQFTSFGFDLATLYTIGAIDCEASAGTSAATAAIRASGGGMTCLACVARNNACPGFLASGNGCLFLECLADSNTGAASDGFQLQNSSPSAMFCTSRNNGRNGFYNSDGYMRATAVASCLAYGNAAYGFNFAVVPSNTIYLRNCGGGSNTSGNLNLQAGTTNLGFVAITADPFVSGATGNLSLNASAGGGALLRAAGFPGTFPGGLTTGYRDIGAVQHADPAGGSTFNPLGGGLIQ
jgi:hypothetical protein